MIFHQILILLVLLFTVHSDEESNFHLQKSHEEISKFPRLAEMYHLESEVSNGKMTPIGLAERVLDVKIDEKILEKYKEVDVSKGIKEQDDLMNLIGKVNRITVDENLEKEVQNGLTVFEELANGEFLSSVEKTLKTVKEEFKKLQDRVNSLYMSEEFKFKTSEKYIGFYSNNILEFYDELREIYVEAWIWRDIANVDDFLTTAKSTLDQVNEEFSDASVVPLKPLFEKLKQYDNRLLNFKNISEQLDKMKPELEIMELFRDFNQVEIVPENFVRDSKEMIEIRYFHSEKDSLPIDPILREISSFSSKMQVEKRKVEALMGQLADFGEKLKTRQLEIPQGNLSKGLESIQNCLQQYEDDIIDVSKDNGSLYEETVSLLNKINEAIKVIHDLRPKFTAYFNIFKKFKEKVEPIGKLDDIRIRIPELEKLRDVFEKLRPVTPLNATDIGIKFNYVYVGLREELKLDKIAAGIESIANRTDSISSVVLCYKTMKSNVPEIKNETLNLFPVLKKKVNLELQELESFAEVIDTFKDAHRMLEDLKNTKIETREGFPLDEEGVREITEGVRIHEEILNVQKTWNILKEVDIVGNLNQFMENFPNSLKDPIPSLDLTEYHGESKMEILKFLEDVADFQKNSVENSEKLNKMNGRIEEIKKWIDSDENEENGWKDCFENSCDDVAKLPAVTPDAPVVEFKEN